jgi:ribonuclease VapC
VNEPEVVADASAILALLKSEAFGDFDPERLAGAWVSAVNLSEVLAKLSSGGLAEEEADAAIAALDLQIVPFDEAQARAAARLWSPKRRAGLSFADRACLALGLRLGRPVATADRIWATLDVGAEIVLIR